MNAFSLDPYRPGSSLVHRLDSRVRLALAVGYILSVALQPSAAWAAYLLLASLVLAAAVLAELPAAYLIKRGLLTLPFVLAALPLLFTQSGQPLAVFDIGFASLALSQPGLERFLSILLKALISLQAAVILAAVTPFPDLLVALRWFRLPRLLVAVIGLMWRYLFIMVETAAGLMRARASRSADSGRPALRAGGRLAWRARVTGGMAGSLLLRSFERGDRVYAAMLARGYDGEARGLPVPPLDRRAWGLILLGWLVLLVLLLFGWLLAA